MIIHRSSWVECAATCSPVSIVLGGWGLDGDTSAERAAAGADGSKEGGRGGMDGGGSKAVLRSYIRMWRIVTVQVLAAHLHPLAVCCRYRSSSRPGRIPGLPGPATGGESANSPAARTEYGSDSCSTQ